MARIIRHVVANKKRGAALIAALQVIALILIGFFSFFGGSQQSPNKAKTFSQKSGPAQAQTAPAQDQTQTAQDQTDQTDPAQTQTAEPLTAADLTPAEKAN